MTAHDMRRGTVLTDPSGFGSVASQRAVRGGGRRRTGLPRCGRDFFNTQRFQPVIACAESHEAASFFRRTALADYDDGRKIRSIGSGGQQFFNLKSRHCGTGENQSRCGLTDKRGCSFQIFGKRDFKSRIAQLRKNAGNGLSRSKKKKALR